MPRGRADRRGHALRAGTTAWDWDSVSHPQRADHWWDLWVCVYPLQWSFSPVLGSGRKLGAVPNLGVGCTATREEHDALVGLLRQHKSAHSHVRAAIFTTDETLFDPTNPASQPDGEWGSWGTVGGGSRIASHRNTSTCRYLET